MEHRWKERRAARIEAVVYLREQPVTICRSRDVSHDGMFLELDALALGLEPGRCVTISFTLRTSGTPRRHRARGLIVHGGREGIGVLFTGVDAAMRRALSALVDGGEDARDGSSVSRVTAGRWLVPRGADADARRR